MEVKEQGDSIRFIVNSSPDIQTAMARYAGLEGVFLSRDVADSIFNEELKKRFPPQTLTASLKAEVALLSKLLKVAVSFEEYKKEHPKTQKTEADPLFKAEPHANKEMTPEEVSKLKFKKHERSYDENAPDPLPGSSERGWKHHMGEAHMGTQHGSHITVRKHPTGGYEWYSEHRDGAGKKSFAPTAEEAARDALKFTTAHEKTIAKKHDKAKEALRGKNPFHQSIKWEGPSGSVWDIDRYRRHDHGGGENGDDWLDDSQIQEDRDQAHKDHGRKLKELNKHLSSLGYEPNAYFDLGEKGHLSTHFHLRRKPKAIGKTQSGKTIYNTPGHEKHREFTKQDHEDARKLHLERNELNKSRGHEDQARYKSK